MLSSPDLQSPGTPGGHPGYTSSPRRRECLPGTAQRPRRPSTGCGLSPSVLRRPVGTPGPFARPPGRREAPTCTEPTRVPDRIEGGTHRDQVVCATRRAPFTHREAPLLHSGPRHRALSTRDGASKAQPGSRETATGTKPARVSIRTDSDTSRTAGCPGRPRDGVDTSSPAAWGPEIHGQHACTASFPGRCVCSSGLAQRTRR